MHREHNSPLLAAVLIQTKRRVWFSTIPVSNSAEELWVPFPAPFERFACKRLYSRLDPSKETIVYCQSGARASETAGVLQQLSFINVKVYDSSWLGYGNTLDAPANNVTFFNVWLFNSRLSALQDRVNQLENELAEARARK